jgi:hypothetical protein
MRIKDEVRHQFLRAGSTNMTLIGTIHGEYDREGRHWQPHLHLIAQRIQSDVLRSVHRQYYRRTKHVYRPMIVQPLRDLARQVSYLFKCFWPMRMRYDMSAGQSRSRFCRIPEPYHSAYLITLHKFDLLDLMFLLGVRRYGDNLHLIPRHAK